MSSLDYYTPITEFPQTNVITAVILIFVMLFIQVNIHMLYSEELDSLKASLEMRIMTLHQDVESSLLRLTAVEDDTKTLLSAQEDVDADLDNHDELLEQHGEQLKQHEELLKQHGEDISLVAEQAYYISHKGMPGSCWMLNEPIKNYLRGSEATAREIFKHLRDDKSVHEMVFGSVVNGRDKCELNRHHVNSCLYSLLAKGELKKNDSTHPMWSVI